MSRPISQLRRKHVMVNYTEEEFAELQRRFAQSTGLYFSAYMRKVTLGQPVEIKIRNASFDEFLAAIIPLQKELKALRQKLHPGAEIEAEVLELHRQLVRAIEKITLPCMPS